MLLRFLALCKEKHYQLILDGYHGIMKAHFCTV